MAVPTGIQNPDRIADDLRGIIEGDVRFDPVSRYLYATDASIFRIVPLGVVYPLHEGDVMQLCRYAWENGIPLLPRGAGTGLAGESLGRGIVVDFTRYMNRLVSIDADSVVVQPGASFSAVAAELRKHGRRLPVDPASSVVCTIGGLVSTNASGSRSLRYGYTRDYVERVRCVLSDGTVWDVGDVTVGVRVRTRPERTAEDVAQGLREIVRRYWPEIERLQLKRRAPNRCGYLLHDVVVGSTVRMGRFLCGTEGTLAVLTGTRLATLPLPPARAVALAFFDRLDLALEAVHEILPYGPTVCDLMDRRLLHLTRAAGEEYERLIPPAAEAALLLEVEADDHVEAYNRMRLIINRVRRVRRLATHAHEAYSPDEIRRTWSVRRVAASQLASSKAAARPIPFIEDMGVPVDCTREFLSKALSLLRAHGVVATIYGHVGQGKIHVRPFMDLRGAPQFATLETLADEMYSVVLELGGSISSEHGVGLARSPYVRRQYGRLVEAFREVRDLFDGKELLNPRKITGPVHLSTALLRDRRENGQARELASLWPWQPGELEEHVAACTGCGLCRTRSERFRMCPLFRTEGTEHATPRAKASLIRGLLQGELPPDAALSPEFKHVLDLCVNCRMCKLECPAHVDVPHLMLDAKAVYAERNGLPVAEWFASRVELWATLGAICPPLTNWLLARRLVRLVLDRVVGLSAERDLPRFAHRPFLTLAARQGLTKAPSAPSARPQVALFVDLFANYFRPAIAEAALSVLRAHGVDVVVPPDQRPSGMPLLNYGDIAAAREVAAHNAAVLAEYARIGIPIVCTEPTAALMIRDEYPRLVPGDDARILAASTYELGDYLVQLRSRGERAELGPVPLAIAYHAPCHLLALERGRPFLELLRAVPGLRVLDLNAGCSGMAGTYGLLRKNLHASLQAGQGVAEALNSRPLDLVVSECCTCRMQLAHLAPTPAFHPVEILAWALGHKPAATIAPL